MNNKAIHIKSKCHFDDDFLSYIRQLRTVVTIDKLDNYELLNDLLNKSIAKLLLLSETDKSLANSIESYRKIAEISMRLYEGGKCEYALMIKKNTFLLLVEYLKRDEINCFYIINDYLMRLYMTFKREELDYHVFGGVKNMLSMNMNVNTLSETER